MNYPSVSMVRRGEDAVVVVVMSSACDGMAGCHWTLHDAKGNILHSGHSAGWDGRGTGSALSAMKCGRAAAVRLIGRLARRRLTSGV